MSEQDTLYNVIRDGMHMTVHGSELKETDVIQGTAHTTVTINLGEIEPGTELKPGDRIRVDSSGNVTLEQDTREQLEADLNNLCLDCLGLGWNAANDLKKAIRKLLDRQAAITRKEYERPNWDYCETCEALAELTAERDELQSAIDAMENAQFYSMYKVKCEECERLKKVARTQAESFKKLECELAGKQ